MDARALHAAVRGRGRPEEVVQRLRHLHPGINGSMHAPSLGCKAGASGPSVTQLQDAHTAEVRRWRAELQAPVQVEHQWSHCSSAIIWPHIPEVALL